MFIAVSCIVLFTVLLRLYLKSIYSFWEKLKVPTPSYMYFFGNILDVIIFKKIISEVNADIYNKYRGYNYVGMYKCMQPALLARNPELIRDILIKDFNSFQDNEVYVDIKDDIILGKNPFALKGAKWKEVRGHISPSFTTNKIKLMFPLIYETCDKMIEYLKQFDEGVNVNDLSSKYTLENIASCAFGINCEGFTNTTAEFAIMGDKLSAETFSTAIKNLALFDIPSPAKLLNLRLFPKDVTEYLKKVVSETVKHRLSNGFTKNDYLDSMITLRNKINDEKIFNEMDIVSHTGGFLIDGFLTNSTIIGFILYEIAANKHVQNKLKQNIDEVLERFNAQITYEAVQEMNYLDMVVKEGLRKHPPLMQLLKVCNTDYKLPHLYEDNTGPEPIIKSGTIVILPISALHMDESYFPEPERFDPERFSNENMYKIRKNAYIPFGGGPRICLGMKFGLLQTKMAIISIVNNFDIEVNKRTNVPLVNDPRRFVKGAVGGLWLNFNSQNNNLN